MGTGFDDLFFWLGAVVFWWSLVCLMALVLLWGWRREATRAPRRGGYVTQRVSTAMSPPTGTGSTHRMGMVFSSSSEPGRALADRLGTGHRPPRRNNAGEPIPCGCNEAGSPGLNRAQNAAYDAEEMRVLLNDTVLNQDDRSNQDWSRRA